jgi:hypothetical protein
MEVTQEQIPQISNYDPLAAFLHKRLSPLEFGLLFLLANLIVDLFLGWHYGVFLTVPVEGQPPPPPGLLQNLTALVVDFVSEPVVAGIYLWAVIGATHLFRQLQASGVFASENLVGEKVDQSRQLFASPRVFHLIWSVSLIYALSQLAAYMRWVPWNSAGGFLELYPEMSFYRLPFWFLNFYTLAFAAFNVAVTVKTLRALFRSQSVDLLVLHPDRCGGLSSISLYSVKVAYAIASAGLVISAATVYELQRGSLADAYPILLGIVAYLLLAPLFFFWPLGTAHEAMREAKETELLELAQRFDRVYSDLKKRVGMRPDNEKADAGAGNKAPDESGVEADMRRLDHLQKLYTIAEKFPVWPFDVENLRRFFAVITAPVLPALISITIDLLTPVITNLFS